MLQCLRVDFLSWGVVCRLCRDFAVTSVGNSGGPAHVMPPGESHRYLSHLPVLVPVVRTSPTGAGRLVFFYTQVWWANPEPLPCQLRGSRPNGPAQPACLPAPAAVAVASHHPPRNWCALLQIRTQQVVVVVVADAHAGWPIVGRDHHHHLSRLFHLPPPLQPTHRLILPARARITCNMA